MTPTHGKNSDLPDDETTCPTCGATLDATKKLVYPVRDKNGTLREIGMTDVKPNEESLLLEKRFTDCMVVPQDSYKTYLVVNRKTSKIRRIWTDGEARVCGSENVDPDTIRSFDSEEKGLEYIADTRQDK